MVVLDDVPVDDCDDCDDRVVVVVDVAGEVAPVATTVPFVVPTVRNDVMPTSADALSAPATLRALAAACGRRRLPDVVAMAQANAAKLARRRVPAANRL